MHNLKNGDVVSLKSGGPAMTIYSVDGVGVEEGIFCKWFVIEKGNQVLKEGLFQPEMPRCADRRLPAPGRRHKNSIPRHHFCNKKINKL